MSIQSGSKVGPLPDIQRVLRKWCHIINEWCERRNWDDVPWWYNERASLGLLATAVWATGGVMLEEYSTEKGKEKKQWQGRGDLFLQVGKGKYVIEAKQKWVSISTRANEAKAAIEKSIGDAKKAARETRANGGRRLGAVFVVPYMPKGEVSKVDKQIRSLVSDLKSIKKVNLAWVFPEKARRDFQYKGYLYPGIAILLQPLRKL